MEEEDKRLRDPLTHAILIAKNYRTEGENYRVLIELVKLNEVVLREAASSGRYNAQALWSFVKGL